MMQRLREQISSPDPATAKAAALLAAMPPLDGDRLRRPSIHTPETGRRAAAGRLRAALVLAISLGSVAAAAATLRETGWLGRAHRADSPTVASPSNGPGSPASANRPHGPSHGAGADATAITEPSLAAPTVALEQLPEAPAPHAAVGLHTHLASGSHSTKDASRAAAASAAAEESALIVGAVRALRRDADPARAFALAEESLQRYPHGVQVEEAMALAMEGAAAAGNTGAARQAAQRYITNFPGGRFADRAGRILASTAK